MAIQMIRNGEFIDVDALQESWQLQDGLIQPAICKPDSILADEHAADPIKKLSDIEAISRFLIDNERFRDNMLFIVGINFGLRVSDLCELRFCHLINDSFRFKETFPVFEKKTRNTRKTKKNRYITINQSVVNAVTLYLRNTPNVKLSDYMFRCQSNRGKNSEAPLSRQSVDRILKGIADDLELDIKVSTHTLRKTFCYHQMLISGNDPRKLLLLQKIMGHSSVEQTLDYIGITREEISEAYKELNLGMTAMADSPIRESLIIERDAV